MMMVSVSSSFQVKFFTNIIIMIFVTSTRRGGVMAFRTAHHQTLVKNNNNMQQHLHTSVSMRRPRLMIANNSCRLPQIQNTACYMSTKPSLQDNYNSMTVSELRDILKARGLKISGIKADLIERVSSGEHKVGNRPPRQKKEKKVIMKNEQDDDVEILAEEEDDDSVDNLAGLVDHLKSMENKDRQVEKKKSKPRGGGEPNNLIFAKEGEEDSDSDEEWGSDDDDDDEYDEYDDPNSTAKVPEYEIQGEKRPPGKGSSGRKDFQLRNGNQIDFQGTRVFVQGLPEEATWKDLKDHFQQHIDGEVVYASVSMDKSGRSKQCGIIQFETPLSAQTAIRDMRNFPLNGAKLYVREDFQESRGGGGQRGNNNNDDWQGGNDRSERFRQNDRLPDVWKRANDEGKDGSGANWYALKDEELKEIEDLIEKRDMQRRQRNYKMSDKLRNVLKEDFGVHLDDRLKLWWTDTQHGGVPDLVSEIKGEGRWGSLKPWRQIPTTEETDALVDTDVVMNLLNKRDKARRRRDFDTADDLLQRAHDAPQGETGLRIHDESRTWRIWTERPPTKKVSGYENLTPGEMCIQLVKENEPDKVEEMVELLRKFPGREWNIFKKLRGRYNVRE